MDGKTMRVKYNSITIAGTGAPAAISATFLSAMDFTVSGTAAFTLTDASNNILANVGAGLFFTLPGAGRNPWGDEDRLDLSQYKINIAGGQTAYVAYSTPA